MVPSLHIATSEDERQAVFGLRYATFVAEMQLFGSKADHLGRLLMDPLDDTARHLCARSSGELVGAIRMHEAADMTPAAHFEDLFSFSRFEAGAARGAMLVVSMLTTHSRYRESDLALELLRGVARIAVEEGYALVFVASQPHLLNLYFSLGFRSYGSRSYNDPELGVLVPLVLLTRDLDHLEQLRSPLLNVFPDRPPRDESTTRLLAQLDRAAGSSFDGPNAEAWSGVYARLADARGSGPRFFDGLTVDDVRAVVSHGHTFACQPGDRVIRKGQTARNVLVVLSGNLEVREGDRILAVAVPGDAVGELAFLLGARRTANVFAGRGGAELLNLDEEALHRLVENPTRIAAVLLLNMSRSLARKLAETTALLQPPGSRLFHGGGLF